MHLIQDYINRGKVETLAFRCIRGHRSGDTINATIMPRELRVYFSSGYNNGISPRKAYKTSRLLTLGGMVDFNTIRCQFKFDYSVWETEMPFELQEE